MSIAAGGEQPATTIDDTRYWVAFDLIPGLGPVRFERLLAHYGGLEDAWTATPASLRTVLDERIVQRILDARKRGTAERMWERLAETGVRALCQDDTEYPRMLKEISAAPPVIYVRGEFLPEDNVAVAIVGTRKMTPYGRDMAYDIAEGLGRSGVTVVSGLALGIDGEAHRAALDAGGRTIAVMGCGVNVPYPAAHQPLTKRIVEHGALVSDYPPDRKPEATNFPARNRIISGLSLATVVIEAPQRSGALITVDFAADQGRDVFVVPGNVNAPMSAGCNALLREGARPVRDAQDILDDLKLSPMHQRQEQAAVQTHLPLDDDERRLLGLLSSEPQHIDEIAAAASRPIHETASQLLLLELKGLVRNAGAQHYARA